MKKVLFITVLILSVLWLGAPAFGQCVSLTTMGSAYTQNFDTLSNTAGSTTNNLTIPGWFLTESGGGARDNEQYAVDDGLSTTGDMFSYGSAASTDRALGQLRSGTLIPLFGACFTNNTGLTISSTAIAYTGEEWRLGTISRTDQMNFEYSTNATDLVTGTWTGVSALNFVTPATTTTGAKDGNAAANRTAKSSTISGLSIANGATFWIRWNDIDASGADDGLAVDNFSLTPNNTPPPPNLTINDVSLNEGNSGTTTFTFTASLSSSAPAGGVTFDISTADGTAAQPADYTANSLTSQTIPAGNSTYTFNVLVNGDMTVETNETFFVNLLNVTGANVTDGQGQGTIVNDDVANNPPTITPQSTSIERGAMLNNVTIATVTDDGGNGNVNVSVTSANPSGGITLSNITNTNGTITATVSAACDASSTSFTLSASDGVNPPVTAILNESVADSNVATQLLFFSQPTDINSGAVFNPVVSVTVANACGAVVSNSTASVTLTLNGTNGTLGGTTTVSAINGITAFTDLTVNASETGVYTLSASSAGLNSATSNSFTVMAQALPVIQFEQANYSDDESQIMTLFVTRSGDLSGTSTVQYGLPAQTLGAAATGGASCNASGVDYVIPSGTLTFDPQVSQRVIEIQLCSDMMAESFEYFSVQLFNPSNAALGKMSTATAEINDTASQFVNSNGIAIVADGGNPYPASLIVNGAPATISSLRLTLYDMELFSIPSEQLDLLLVGPQGQSIMLMGNVGGATAFGEPVTLTFDDAAGQVLPDNDAVFRGSYEPTTWNTNEPDFPAPAPPGPYQLPGSEIGGTVTLASVFGGTNPNGEWKLYIRNQSAPLQKNLGIGGLINGGWGLQFLAPTAAAVSISGQLLLGKSPLANQTVMLTGGTLNQPVIVKTNSFGNYSFEGLTAGETYAVTVVSSRYNFPNPTKIFSAFDNVTDADFEAEER